jgi:putative sigma-54 modulation protein
MNWLLKDQGTRRPAELPDHIERRLRFALARFGDRVEKVVVFLHDHNGPKGGIDKVCRILAKVRGCGMIMATVTDSDWKAAVDRATTRMGHTVSRRIGRLRDRHAPASRADVAELSSPVSR